MTRRAPQRGNRTILVVDDEESILHILEAGLTDNGYEVLTATNAMAALDIARTRQFQYALLDIRLPDLDGIKLSLEIKKYLPGAINILMTGYPGIKSAVEALRHHAYDYLIKPFRVDQVVSVIERSTRERQLLGEHHYSAEVIRTLRQENEQLRAMLRELMPDETRLRAKSFSRYRTLRSDREVALRSYAQQQKGDSPGEKE